MPIFSNLPAVASANKKAYNRHTSFRAAVVKETTMTRTRFYFVPAIVAIGFCGIGHADAYPLTITLPSRAIPAPPPNPTIPVLLGSWHDGPCLLLPPGVIPFEAVSDTITFRQDGTFTQVINKATGTVRKTGSYRVNGTRLTLNYLVSPIKPVQYEFSRNGGLLLLHPAGSGQSETRILSRIQNRDGS